MGLVKDQWLATRPDHDLEFFCPQCGYHCSIGVRPPDLPVREDEENDFAEETVECMRCDSDWIVEITASQEGYGAALQGHPETQVVLSAADWSYDGEDWGDIPEPEPQAYDIFQDALKDWWALLRRIGDQNSGASSINRMLFIHLFSILEAYLYDEVLGLAVRDSRLQSAIINTLPKLKEQTVLLSAVATNPNLVRDQVTTALQGVSFHKLRLVDEMCRPALGEHFLPSEKSDRDFLHHAINTRHDCVHRNGHDKEGKQASDITVDWLGTLSKHFEAMAKKLQSLVADRDAVRNFFQE